MEGVMLAFDVEIDGQHISDKAVQENPFTEEELKEMRRQDYLELKKEFEPQR